jgi:hypothetical protein
MVPPSTADSTPAFVYKLIRRPRLRRSQLIAEDHQTEIDASDRILFVVK